MGVYANRPIAVAPYMGENVFIATLAVTFAWQDLLGAVFVSGLFFLILTLLRLRTWMAKGGVAHPPAEADIEHIAGVALPQTCNRATDRADLFFHLPKPAAASTPQQPQSTHSQFIVLPSGSAKRLSDSCRPSNPAKSKDCAPSDWA